MVGVGVGSAGNGCVDTSVLLFSFVVRVGVGSEDNDDVDDSLVKLSADSPAAKAQEIYERVRR